VLANQAKSRPPALERAQIRDKIVNFGAVLPKKFGDGADIVTGWL
jgi:hypothetical protein